MINRFRLTTLDYNSNDALTISALRNNSAREPKIQITEYFTHFSHNWVDIHPFTYITWQALSKLLPGSLRIDQRSITGPDTTYDTKYIADTLTPPDYNTIIFASIAPSNMKKTQLKQFRQEHGGYTTEKDTLFKNFTEEAVLGINTYNNNKSCIVFVSKDSRIYAINQLKIMCLIYTMMYKPEDENNLNKEETLFRELTMYFVCENTALDTLQDIFINYASTLKEYIIDKGSQIELIYNKLRSKKAKTLEGAVRAAKENLRYALDNVARCTEVYNDVNQDYTNFIMNDNNELKTEMQNAFEFIDRSNRIITNGIYENKLWFTVHTPIYINDKDEWERMSNKLITDNLIRECVNKAFITEEFEIWTEACIFFDLESYRVGRYGSSDRSPGENAIPHPHLQGFNCFGQHSAIIANLITKGSILSALEQAIEAASGLNIFDGPVVNKFLHYLTIYNNNKCFKKDNEWFSIEDYIRRNTENENIKTNSDTNN